jgi:hypothetical protein
MKKAIVAFVGLVVIVGGLLLWYDQSRRYYCLDAGQCITVWKRLGGVCYVIPGHYSSVSSPSKNYIQCLNTNILTLFWTKQQMDRIIVLSEYDLEIVNRDTSGFILAKYDSLAVSEIYDIDAKRMNEVKVGVDLMEVHIKENYAYDKNGNRL